MRQGRSEKWWASRTIPREATKTPKTRNGGHLGPSEEKRPPDVQSSRSSPTTTSRTYFFLCQYVANTTICSTIEFLFFKQEHASKCQQITRVIEMRVVSVSEQDIATSAKIQLYNPTATSSSRPHLLLLVPNCGEHHDLFHD
jgi:hypothetical protein